MSVRKRVWRNSKGEILNAWVCGYSDQNGKRHLKSFKRKKDATDFKATATVEIRHGIHTPDSQSPTVSEAAAVWLENCEAEGLKRATLAQYRQHVDLHLGQTKLSRLPTSLVCDFRDKLRRGDPPPGETAGRARSAALIRKIVTSLGSLIGHAKERGKFSGANPVRDLAKGKNKRAERRQKSPLQVGVDIPSVGEIKRLFEAAPPRQMPLLMTAYSVDFARASFVDCAGLTSI